MQDYVVVPRRFVSAHPHFLDAEQVTLSDPNGNIFHVGVMIKPREIRVKGGFANMSDMYQLVANAFIHFSFVGGTRFDIRVFYHHNVEVDYPEFNEEPPDNALLLCTANLSSTLCSSYQPLVISINYY